MTNVFANTAALTLLQGTGAEVARATSADTIVRIAASIEDEKKSRAADDVISSVASQSDLSTLGKIVAATTLANASVEGASNQPVATEAEWNAAADKAVNQAIHVIGAAVMVNGKFHLEEEIDIDGLLGKIETARQEKIGNGESEEGADIWAAAMERIAPAQKRFVEMGNGLKLRNAEAAKWSAPYIAGRYGLGESLSIDNNGKAKVSSFQIVASSGQNLLSLGEDGTLTTFNQDGSIRTQQSKADVIMSAKYGGNSFLNALKQSGYDLTTSDLF